MDLEALKLLSVFFYVLFPVGCICEKALIVEKKIMIDIDSGEGGWKDQVGMLWLHFVVKHKLS